MVSITSLKPGDVVYETKREKMGNTTMSRSVTRPVRIIEVFADSPSPHVVAAWNGNTPRKFYGRSIRSWRRSEPK